MSDRDDSLSAARRRIRRLGARSGGRRIPIALVAVGAVLITLGAASLRGDRAGARADFGTLAAPTTSSSAPAATAPPSTSPSRTDRPTAPRATTARPTAHRAFPARAADGLPVRLRLPSLQVDAPVGAVVSRDGALAVPENPSTLGWWTGGARPGTARGSVVIDGHVDSAATGPGALYRLVDLPAGAPVEISTATGTTLRYRVYGRRHYVKTGGLPPSLFTRSGPARLLLITCGGAFDRSTGSYADNVVVFAQPA